MMLKAISAPLVISFWAAPAILAQGGNSFLGLATTAEKRFEVATVKLNESRSARFQLGPPGGGSISITNVTLRGIIVQAFRTQRDIVLGIPSWAETEKYDIVGKGPDPQVTWRSGR